jgi:succinyl-CoA synthetase beta subunit
MKIHEYQAKAIFRERGMNVPQGKVAETPEEAVKIAGELGKFPVVVKAQVHAGGRGKAGGVKLAKSLDEVRAHAGAILGMDIKGIKVLKVLVEEAADIQREIYAGIVIDRAQKCPVLMVSAAGGVDIEEVAASNPEKILKLAINPSLGLCDFQIRQAAFFLDIPKSGQRDFAMTMRSLYEAFMQLDCALAEINPLVVTGDEQILACDGKMDFDDNALGRHPHLLELRDESGDEPLEVEARRSKVNYVKLDGSIGCLVNGAGLAMGTMDMVKHFGGEPANFLDVGGGAGPDQIAEALRIVTSDPSVKVILFNIFGGIVRCDRVASGILQAREKVGLKLPVVMRLVGTNEAQAREMLAGTELEMLPTMAAAAQRAVELAKAAA